MRLIRSFIIVGMMAVSDWLFNKAAKMRLDDIEKRRRKAGWHDKGL